MGRGEQNRHQCVAIIIFAVTKLNQYAVRMNHTRMLIASGPAGMATSTHRTFKHHYVVPLETSTTYTQRRGLSKLLAEKIEISHKNASVPHAVVMHGLGGTGKSQLALRFVEDHKDKYNPVLWIDATDVEAVQSSFERCADELEIRVDSKEMKGLPWTDSKVIQTVLRWLCNRKEADEEWLVVIDNADDASWGLKKVIPQAKRGSIIITSRDNLSQMLVDGECEKLEVDVMSSLEARTLLLQRLQWDVESAPEKTRQGCDAVVRRLGHLALAVDLAGAYISNELNHEIALMQYAEDYDKHQDELLQDDRFRGLLPTEKTVSTVWNTTFEKLEKDYARFLPTALLAFFARFQPNIIQDEIFRLASLGIAGVDRELGEVELSGDIRQFIKFSDTGWDCFLYRQSRDVLIRYSLVQRVTGEWPGVTMHSLVRWRALQYKKERRWEWWYLVLVLAACHHLTQEHESPQFRRHLLVYVPELTEAQLGRSKLGEKSRLFMQRTFSRVHYTRQEVLFHIHKALTDADGRGIVVLYGMGGVGKTRLAANYAENHRANYSDIFWVDTETEDSAKMSYAGIAKQIMQEHPSAVQFSAITTDSEEDEVVTAVKKWLIHPRNTRWLMICDNYHDFDAEDIRRLLPEADHGSVIG